MCVCRACVVSVDWLVECFKQSRTVSEQPYICQTFDQCFTNAATTSIAVTSAAVAPAAGAPVGASGAVLVDDGGMNALPSQYLLLLLY